MHPHPEHKFAPLFVPEATTVLLQGATVTRIVMIEGDIQGDACTLCGYHTPENAKPSINRGGLGL